MSQNEKSLSLCSVILNEVKNLYVSANAYQILRNAQTDNMTEENHIDTPSYNLILSEIRIIILPPTERKETKQ